MLAQVFAREISDLEEQDAALVRAEEERQAQRNDWHAAEQQFHFERTRARELEAAASAMRADELARERALQQEVAQGRTHEALVAELRQRVRDAKADRDAHAQGLVAAVQRLAAQLAEKDVELQDLRAANEARAAAAAASAVSAAAAAATFKSAPATPQHPQQHSSSLLSTATLSALNDLSASHKFTPPPIYRHIVEAAAGAAPAGSFARPAAVHPMPPPNLPAGAAASPAAAPAAAAAVHADESELDAPLRVSGGTIKDVLRAIGKEKVSTQTQLAARCSCRVARWSSMLLLCAHLLLSFRSLCSMCVCPLFPAYAAAFDSLVPPVPLFPADPVHGRLVRVDQRRQLTARRPSAGTMDRARTVRRRGARRHADVRKQGTARDFARTSFFSSPLLAPLAALRARSLLVSFFRLLVFHTRHWNKHFLNLFTSSLLIAS